MSTDNMANRDDELEQVLDELKGDVQKIGEAVKEMRQSIALLQEQREQMLKSLTVLRARAGTRYR